MPDLHKTYTDIKTAVHRGEVTLLNTTALNIRAKLTGKEKCAMKRDEQLYKYIEISDVTKYGLITHYTEGSFATLPTRGEYKIHTGDILLALNNSSRGTVVLVLKNLTMLFVHLVF